VPYQSRKEPVLAIQRNLRHCEDCRSNESTMKKYNCPGSHYNQTIQTVFAEA
jgi:hypothetical protein